MANQIVVSAGAKVRNLDGVLTATSGVVSSVPLGAANGVATLDSGGKVPVSQLPSSVVTYLGTWNATTNTPTLVNGIGDAGDMYLCNVAGTVNFGAGPVTFAVGDWVLYGSGTWQKSNGQNGTVTSVAASITGSAIGLTGSPITTAGTLAFAFSGTSGQYVNGAGNLTTFPTLITSIGLSMPSAFSVANSPLTANGTIAVTGAGTTAQYIRGDGSLATFPTIATEAQRLITEVYNETGATLTKGTVVYINGGHGNLPTITKAIATGDATSAQTYGIVQTDITNMNNGYVVVIGSLGDLDTQAYANGTQLYLSSTVAGAWTSVKQYAPAHLVYVAIVTRSHPTQGVVEVRIQNGFEMDELHNVSAQSPLNNQGLFYNTSTSLWENKSIATALGYTPADDANVVHLTGNETIGGTKTFSDATKNNGGIFLQNASSNSLAGYMNIGGLTNGVKFTSGGGVSNTFTLPSATGYTFTFDAITGTIAMLEGTQTFSGSKTFTGSATFNSSLGNSITLNYGAALVKGNTPSSTSGVLSNIYAAAGNNNLVIADNANISKLQFQASSSYTYTFPSATGTIALVGGSGVGTVTSVAALTIGTSGTDLSSSVANSTTTPVITLNVPTASATNRGALSSADWTTFNNKQSALTNPVTGTGTTNYLPKFTGTSTIGNSILQDDGTYISIGYTTNPSLYKLDVNGTGRFTGAVTISGHLNLQGAVTRNINFLDSSNTNINAQIQYDQISSNSGQLFFGTNNAGSFATRLTIASTGAATFSSSVTAQGGSSSGFVLNYNANVDSRSWAILNDQVLYGDFQIQQSTTQTGGTRATKFYISPTGAATFSSSVTAGDDITISKTSANLRLFITNTTATTGRSWYFNSYSNGNLYVGNTTAGDIFNFSSTGAATFSSTVYASGSITTAGYVYANGGIIGNNSNNLYLSSNSSGGEISFWGNQLNTRLMTLLGNGNLGIGTSSPNEKLDVNGAIQFRGDTQGYSNTTSVGMVDFYSGIARMLSFGADGSTYGGFDFYQAKQNNSGGRSAMRITSGGALCLGVTSAYGTNLLNVNGGIYATSSVAAVVAADLDMMVFQNTGATYTKSCLVASMTATGGTGSYFFYGQQSTSTAAIKIFSNGNIQNTNNSYGAISDARLKENIKDATPKLDDLMKVKVRNYNLKGESNKQLGVISQELEAIFPNMIEESTNMGENMKIKGVKYSVFVPMLIKAVQEQQQQINELKQLLNK